MFVKKHVNLVNSPTWVKMNEDAQCISCRDAFLDINGGNFRKNRNGSHTWEPGIVEESTVQTNSNEYLGKYIIETSNNTLEYTNNFAKYCREHNLNKAAMYSTLRGDRKHHKGNKLIKSPN